MPVSILKSMSGENLIQIFMDLKNEKEKNEKLFQNEIKLV